jgi:hypothetical protein
MAAVAGLRDKLKRSCKLNRLQVQLLEDVKQCLRQEIADKLLSRMMHNQRCLRASSSAGYSTYSTMVLYLGQSSIVHHEAVQRM